MNPQEEGQRASQLHCCFTAFKHLPCCCHNPTSVTTPAFLPPLPSLLHHLLPGHLQPSSLMHKDPNQCSVGFLTLITHKLSQSQGVETHPRKVCLFNWDSIPRLRKFEFVTDNWRFSRWGHLKSHAVHHELRYLRSQTKRFLLQSHL